MEYSLSVESRNVLQHLWISISLWRAKLQELDKFQTRMVKWFKFLIHTSIDRSNTDISFGIKHLLYGFVKTIDPKHYWTTCVS